MDVQAIVFPQTESPKTNQDILFVLFDGGYPRSRGEDHIARQIRSEALRPRWDSTRGAGSARQSWPPRCDAHLLTHLGEPKTNLTLLLWIRGNSWSSLEGEAQPSRRVVL